MKFAALFISILVLLFVSSYAMAAGMAQLDYLDQSALPALEGGLVDSGPTDVRSFSTGSNVAQVTTITLSGTPNNSAAYTVTVNGIPVTFTTDGSATLQELYNGLLAALQAVSWLVGVINFTGNGTTIITATAVKAGTAFTLTETADPGNNMVVATGTANVTASPVPFGRAIHLSASPDTGVLPSATGFNFQGFSLNRATGRPISYAYSASGAWQAGDQYPVLRKGRIYLIPESTGAITASVYIRHTQGAQADWTPGRVRADDDSGKVDAYTTLKWLATPVAGQLTPVEVNLPQ